VAAVVRSGRAERGKKRRAMDNYGLPEFQGLVRTVDRKGADYRR